jgi:uncharacterized protein (TIGR02466 family)
MILIFSTGIHNENLHDPVLNKKLEKLGRQLIKTHSLEHDDTWGEQAHAPDLKHPVLQDFFKAVTAPLNGLVQHYHIDANYSFNFQNLWFNLNRKGDYNVQHAHGGTDFSASYCIKCEPGSGDLVFVNPNQAKFLLNLSSTYQFKNLTSVNAHKYTFKTKPMELCIFPAELQHYVTRNNNKQDRLSLSFNVKIVETV